MIARRAVLSLLMAGAVSAPALAQQQPYPTRAVRMIVPFTPGSPVDVVARLVAQHLTERLGQSVIVDNRPGGGTTSGMKAAAVADPDGYTLLFQSSSIVVAPAMYRNLDYDPLKAFEPVAAAAESHWVMVVPPSLPIHNVKELIEYARANPGQLNFGFGQGTAPQLAGEWLKATSKISIASVPYRGGAQAITDMLGGRIHLNIGTTATLVPLIRQGKLRPIAFWGPVRHRDLPDVPTMMESGFPGLALSFWVGMVAPAGTSQEVVGRLNHDMQLILKSPEMTKALDRIGFEPMFGSTKEFSKFLADEAPKWAKIVETSGVKVE